MDKIFGTQQKRYNYWIEQIFYSLFLYVVGNEKIKENYNEYFNPCLKICGTWKSVVLQSPNEQEVIFIRQCIEFLYLILSGISCLTFRFLN